MKHPRMPFALVSFAVAIVLSVHVGQAGTDTGWRVDQTRDDVAYGRVAGQDPDHLDLRIENEKRYTQSLTTDTLQNVRLGAFVPGFVLQSSAARLDGALLDIAASGSVVVTAKVDDASVSVDAFLLSVKGLLAAVGLPNNCLQNLLDSIPIEKIAQGIAELTPFLVGLADALLDPDGDRVLGEAKKTLQQLSTSVPDVLRSWAESASSPSCLLNAAPAILAKFGLNVAPPVWLLRAANVLFAISPELLAYVSEVLDGDPAASRITFSYTANAAEGPLPGPSTPGQPPPPGGNPPPPPPPAAAAATISVDRGEGGSYAPGDAIQVCYTVSRPMYIQIVNTLADGSSHVFIEGNDDGAGDCLTGEVTYPTGTETFEILGESGAYDSTFFYVVEPQAPPPASRTVPIDFLDACNDHYEFADFAAPENRNFAYSWRCYVDDYELGGLDRLDDYCIARGFPGGAILNGPVEGPNAAYNWYCTDVVGP